MAFAFWQTKGQFEMLQNKVPCNHYVLMIKYYRWFIFKYILKCEKNYIMKCTVSLRKMCKPFLSPMGCKHDKVVQKNAMVY